MNNQEKICLLHEQKTLAPREFAELLGSWNKNDREFAAGIARDLAQQRFGNKIFIRGLVEFSNFCKNDCLYCGIRRSNRNAERYRLCEYEIIDSCNAGYEYGFRTFVLQSGEDRTFSVSRIAALVRELKKKHPDCAVTLSIGELSRSEYEELYHAGADRYLLRHETADEEHYNRLHPPEMSFASRMRCLHDLKEIGFQTGCGFMVGSPGQTPETLAKDLEFIRRFKPEMIGIGPFIPQHDTPFGNEKTGSVNLTLFLLSLCRIMLPDVLLPATTALGTLDPAGCEKGILAGANVVMPNISPYSVRRKYLLYDNKNIVGTDSHIEKSDLQKRLNKIGYTVAISRGDHCGASR